MVDVNVKPEWERHWIKSNGLCKREAAKQQISAKTALSENQNSLYNK